MLTTLAYHLHLYVFLAQREKRKEMFSIRWMCVRFVLVFHFAPFRSSKSVATSLAELALESAAPPSSEGCSESNLWVMRQLSPTVQPPSRAASVLSHLSSDSSPLPIFFLPFSLILFFVHIARWSFTGFPRLENQKQLNYPKVELQQWHLVQWHHAHVEFVV